MDLLPSGASIDSPVLRDLFHYWRGLRRGDRLPGRQDVDPANLRPILPYLFLVDVKREPLRLTLRLVGTAVVARLHHDPTGRPIQDIYSNDDWSAAEPDYRAAIDDRRPICRKVDLIGPDGRGHSYERLLLPLAADGFTVDMLLGGAKMPNLPSR